MLEPLQRMLGWAWSNPHYKALSLVLAIGAWLWVQGEEVVQAQARVTVQWSLPDGLVSVAPLPTSVSVNLRGARNVVRRAENAEQRVAIDLADLGVGEHRVEFGMASVQGLPDGVEVLAFTPASIGIMLDEFIVRKVRIRPVQVGVPDRTVTVAGLVASPDVVTLRGPRQALEELVEVSSQPIDVGGIREDGSLPMTLDLPQGAELIDNTRLEARVDVEARLSTRTFTEVPIYTWQQPDWRVITPSVQVTLEGPAAILRGMSAEEVLAFVHLPSAPNRTRYEAPWGPEEGLRVRVVHPGDAEVVVIGMDPPTAEVFKP